MMSVFRADLSDRRQPYQPRSLTITDVKGCNDDALIQVVLRWYLVVNPGGRRVSPLAVLCGTADVVGCVAKGFNVRDRYALGKGRGGCKKTHTDGSKSTELKILCVALGALPGPRGR